MSNEFENIVRPFQSGETAPSQTYYPAGQVGVPNIKLAYGRNGQGKTLSGSESLTATYYMAKAQNEKRRRRL